MKNNWITKFIGSALILIFWSSTCFSANYLNLKSFNNFIYGKDIIHLACYTKSDKPEKDLIIKINSVDKIIYDLADYEFINFDISSTNNVIKWSILRPPYLTLYSINLKSLEFSISELKINYKDSNIVNAVNKNNAFNLLNTYQPNYNFVLNCAIVWNYKLFNNEDKYYNKFLEEASIVSQKPKCKGIGGLGPNDPSINWNSCVGIKKGSDSVYIGEFVDGYYHGQGIEIFEKTDEIYVGNFKEDYMDGSGTLFIQAETLFEVSDQFYKKSWIASGKFVEDELSSENAKLKPLDFNY